MEKNIVSYPCKFDNNVQLKIVEYNGNNLELKKMYDFYNGGTLLLREPKKRQIISNLINKNIIDKNKNFIDGGAFLGDTSLPLCLNIKGTIYTIDPGDINIQIIQELVEINKISNIKLLKYCLGYENEILFYNNGLYGINFTSFSKIKGDRINEIESISLDELYKRGIIENIDFIHIDVENYENEVIKGSFNLIKMYNPVIIFEGHIKSCHEKVEECLCLLKNMDYTIYMIDEDAGYPGDARNFLSIPKDRLDFFKNEFGLFNYIILL